MAPVHHPLAVPADQIVSDIERRRADDPTSRFGYECLFLTKGSTRPAMKFEIFPQTLSSIDWRAEVSELVQRAKSEAEGGEAIYFEPY